MRAVEIMSTPVMTVSAALTTKQAAKMLVENGITAAPVVSEDGTLAGIVSEADLLRREIQPDPRAHLTQLTNRAAPACRRVTDVMTRHVISVRPSADAADIVALMLDAGIKSVPVVEDNAPVGMVTRRDLLATLVRDDESIAAEVTARLSDYGSGSSSWAVDVVDGVVTLTGDTTIDDFRVARLLAGTVIGVRRVHPGPTHRRSHGGCLASAADAHAASGRLASGEATPESSETDPRLAARWGSIDGT